MMTLKVSAPVEGEAQLPWLPRTRVVAGLKWFGTVAGVAGATAVAANVGYSAAGFSALFVSSLMWIFAGMLMREPSIVLMYVVFTAINTLGLLRAAA